MTVYDKDEGMNIAPPRAFRLVGSGRGLCVCAGHWVRQAASVKSDPKLREEMFAE